MHLLTELALLAASAQIPQELKEDRFRYYVAPLGGRD